MQLETNRYILKVLDPSYYVDLLAYNERNRLFHKDSMPKRDDDFFTLDNSKYILEEELKKSKNGNFYRFYIFQKGNKNIIGDISMYDIKYGNIASAFIGIKIDKDYTQQGIASEVIENIISYAKYELDLHSLRVTILEENLVSQKLFTKFGFKFDGKVRDLFLAEDGWKSHELYSLIL